VNVPIAITANTKTLQDKVHAKIVGLESLQQMRMKQNLDVLTALLGMFKPLHYRIIATASVRPASIR
jgi:hypothetical protein